MIAKGAIKRALQEVIQEAGGTTGLTQSATRGKLEAVPDWVDFCKPAPGKALLPSGPVRYWTDTEHAAFLVGLNKHSRNWSRISTEFGKRTPAQITTLPRPGALW